jgi:HlyD family secretion protein
MDFGERSMRSRWLWLGLGVAIAVPLLWRWWLAPEVVEVRAVRAEPGRVESTVTNTKAGTVRARRRARLAPEIGGRIASIAHREGERVEAGEPILELDDAAQSAELELARQALRASEAARREACILRDRALRSLERKRELAAGDIVSRDQLDELQSGYDAAAAACTRAAAEVESARAQIERIEVALEKLVIRAPFAGVVAEVQGEVGEWVTPSPPLLVAPAAVDLIDLSELYVSAPMDEVDAARIAIGQPVRVTVDSHPGRGFSGRVVRIAPYVLDVEAQNRTVEIEVDLGDMQASDVLLPGTSADVEVVLVERDAALRVPTSALLQGDRVLVANDGTLEERAVEVGLRNWNWAEVTAGLEAGQLVVTSLDRPEVRAGAHARIEIGESGP